MGLKMRLNSGKEGKYVKDLLKIKFNSDDNLTLNKLFKLHMLTIVVNFFLKRMKNIIHKGI